MLGCWNLQYFRTAQLYFKLIFDCFDIFGISEHSLFQEQLDLIKAATGNIYNCHAASALTILLSSLGKLLMAERLWFGSMPKMKFIIPLETIDSDRIMGLKCDFLNYSSLSILSVYLPSMNDKIKDFNEYFEYLWAVYDTLSTECYVIWTLMGILGIL